MYYERPLLDDLLALKGVLMRKYQRRRASSEDVASVEKLIAEQTDVGSVRCAEPTPQCGAATADE
jgi:hypothetical protein